MDNNKKLDFIVQLERRRKIKRIATLVAILIFAGVVLIYFQVMNYQDF